MKALMKEESRLRSKKRKLAIKQPVTANSSLRDTAYVRPLILVAYILFKFFLFFIKAGQHSAKPPAPGKKRKLDMHKLKIGPKTSAEKRTRFDVSYKIPKRMPQTHVYSVQTRPRKVIIFITLLFVSVRIEVTMLRIKILRSVMQILHCRSMNYE
jgi:hypothetical protein